MKREPTSMRVLPDTRKKVVEVTARLRRRTAKAPSRPNRTSTLSKKPRKSPCSAVNPNIAWRGVGAIVHIPAALDRQKDAPIRAIDRAQKIVPVAAKSLSATPVSREGLATENTREYSRNFSTTVS